MEDPDTESACRICGSTDAQPAMTVAGVYGSTWVACAGCTVRRIHPYPSEAELAAYYDDRYREKDDFGSALGFEVSHRVRYSPEYADRVKDEYRQSLADVGIAVGPATRALDYGCADGGFLDFLAEQGVPTGALCGVDISREMINAVIERGLRGLTLDEQGQLDGESFDLITLWDVIEHVPDPVATLAALRPLLAPGGRLLMQTPRFGLLAETLGERFEHFLPFEHLHLFTRDALRFASERAGYAVGVCASFGANAPADRIPSPYKLAYDRLAKLTDHGATQLVVIS